jgi:cytochrome P450
MEMRLLLAHLLWNFDFELCGDSLNWVSEQKTYVLWEKNPLNVRITPTQENAMSL